MYPKLYKILNDVKNVSHKYALVFLSRSCKTAVGGGEGECGRIDVELKYAADHTFFTLKLALVVDTTLSVQSFS